MDEEFRKSLMEKTSVDSLMPFLVGDLNLGSAQVSA